MKPEDAGKVIQKFSKRDVLGLKTVFGPYHIGGQAKGFTIFETDDPSMLANYTNYYTPELTMVIYPIHDSKGPPRTGSNIISRADAAESRRRTGRVFRPAGPKRSNSIPTLVRGKR